MSLKNSEDAIKSNELNFAADTIILNKLQKF